jgi:hypothetical protein
VSAPARVCTVVGGLTAQAVVLQRTLAAVLPEADLTVVCTRPREARALAELGLDVVPAELLEEGLPKLRQARQGRSESEYCWTLKAPFLLHLLDGRPEGELVTFADADMAFHSDPTPAWDELAGASIGISHHRSAARFRSRERWAGRFNSGWVCFRNDANGLAALRWWQERVLEWCHDRVEHGRFADQAYLEDWPRRFAGVHVLEHPGVNVGPWREGAALAERDGQAEIDGSPVLFFHAQSLRLRRPGRGVRPLPGAAGVGYTVDRGYRPSALERRLLWEPYVQRLGDAVSDLRAVDPGLFERLPRFGAVERARGLSRRAWMRARELRTG